MSLGLESKNNAFVLVLFYVGGVIIVVVALFSLNESENRLTFHLTVSGAAKGLIRIRFYANAHSNG